MDQFITVKRDGKTQDREYYDRNGARNRYNSVHSLGGEQSVADAEAEIDEHDEKHWENRTKHAELRSRLDHLRDAKPRTLH
nr:MULTISPECIES: hypothetical protein [Rhizobium]